MNQSDKNNDKLRAFFIAEESEQAPADFTEKFMELIRKQPAPVVKQNKILGLSPVPVIYCALSAILIIIALFIPNNNADAANGFSWLPAFDNLLPEIPKIEFNIFSNIIIPEMLTYIMFGCLGLFIFDLFLFRYFQFDSNRNAGLNL
jgi:hypothetical protein